MQTHDILFIRGCKSNNPGRRMERLHKMFYCGHFDWSYVLCILTKIISQNNLATVEKIVTGGFLDPRCAEYYGAESDWPYEKRAAYAMISIIRFTNASRIEGYIAPIKFRRMK